MKTKRTNLLLRRDVAKRVAPLVSLTIPQALVVVDSIWDELAKAVCEGIDVEAYGFGKFTTKVIPEHTAHDPRNQEEVTVAARRVLRFHPFPALKERMQQNLNTQTQDSTQKETQNEL